MEFLAAKVWILFWISFTFVMLGYAYYARNEAIQKIASALFVAFVISHIFDGEIFKVPFYALTDCICLIYCIYVWWTIERSNHAPPIIGSIFALMLLTHYAGGTTGFTYDLTLSVLYGLQLITLCRYSRQYGKVAREVPTTKRRDDMFYKIIVWLKIHRPVSH